MSDGTATVNPFRQPKAVWAVAFACVISFMGIGLVDPILPSLSGQLGATHAEVELLFTSYLVVTAVAMLVTGWVSSRIGPKRTLVAGLVLIVVFAALAGMSSGIWGIVGFRAGWGLGNALFIATSLAVIVGSASGGFAGAIVLYETALGLGIATGPLVGGLLGNVSWRGPFFGVAVLMLIALVATVVLLEKTPPPAQKARLSEPITALRHKTLRTTSLVGLLYNWGFFTLLGYAPFLMGGLSPIALGAVFFGWGLLVAAFAVFGAPWLKGHFGTPRTLYGALVGIAVLLVAIGVFDDSPVVVIVAVVLSGIVVGLNNTLVTTAVMSIAPVPRPTASATYGFVRFIGGGLAPFAAGLMAAAWGATVPFVIAAVVVLVGVGLLATIHRPLTEADVESEQPVSHERADAEQAVREVPGLPGEAVIAEDALEHDRHVNRGSSTMSGGLTAGGTVTCAEGVVVLIDPHGRQVARAEAPHGRFEMTVPNPGTFTVLASVPGYRPVARTVSIGDHDALACDFHLEGARVVDGRVFGSAEHDPVVDCHVTAIDADGQVVGHTRSAADGSFRLAGLPTGSVVLSAQRVGHLPDAVATTVDDATVDLLLRPIQSRITGSVTDRTHRPLSGAVATALDPHGRIVTTAVTDHNGCFALSGITPGTYTVVGSMPAVSVTDVRVAAGEQTRTEIRLGYECDAADERERTGQRQNGDAVQLQHAFTASRPSMTDATDDGPPS